MKHDEKEKKTGTEPSAEPTEEPKQLDRGAFLKALGVGIGAVGLDMVTGGHLAARAAVDLDGSRSGIQKLVRGLLENPSKVKDFIDSPQAVAREFGVRLTDADAEKIRETLMKLAKELGKGGLEAGHQNWDHLDGDWRDKYTKDIERGKIKPRIDDKKIKPGIDSGKIKPPIDSGKIKPRIDSGKIKPSRPTRRSPSKPSR